MVGKTKKKPHVSGGVLLYYRFNTRSRVSDLAII